MASATDWAIAYARQADADLRTFSTLQDLAVPVCHRLLFLQMACEKTVKAHLCAGGADPVSLQTSHAYVADTLPVVLRQQIAFLGYGGGAGREAIRRAKHISKEIELLAPAVRRGGKRPDNCEYPWTDDQGRLHVPLDWSFYPAQLLLENAGRTFLKLLHGAIDRLLS